MRFIVLGDLHYASYSDPTLATRRDRLFGEMFRQVAAHQADLVFAIGDTTQRGLLPELSGQTAVAEQNGLALIRTTGNHDTDTLPKTALAPFFLGGHSSAAADDELYTSFEAGPARFVLLDTARPQMSSVNWSGFVSEAQLDWLQAQVEEFNRADAPPYLVVLGHHPLFGTTDRSSDKWLNIENSQAVQERFARLQRGQGLYVCGHNHTNSMAGPDEAGWYYLQAGAPLVCQSYRLVTLDEEGLRVETFDFDLSQDGFQADFEEVRYGIEEGFSVYPLEAVYGNYRDRFFNVPVGAR